MGLDNVFRRAAERPERIDPPSIKVPGEEPGAETVASSSAKEALRAEAESQFNKVASEFKMSPEDLRNLQQYDNEGLRGIKGTINGIEVDLKEIRNAATQGVDYVAVIGERTIKANQAADEFSRLSKALERRSFFDWVHEEKKDGVALRQVRGEG